MVQVLPMRGLCYGPGYAEASVFAPPYDVISSEQQRRLLARSPYNVVRLILGPTPGDGPWYGAAAATLARWVAEGILVRGAAPALYGYRQRFALADGRTRLRSGFIGRIRLGEWGNGVYRHEHTRTGPRLDRLRLTRATRANLSPVFGLYRDVHRELSLWLQPPAQPELAFQDDEGVEQAFWRIAEPAAIAALEEGMARREIVIADGHHRYETALAYRAERRALEGDPSALQPYDFVLMYLTAVEDPGLVILPSHRVIASPPAVNGAALLQALAADFEISSWDGKEPLTTAVGQAAGGQTSGAGERTVALGVCLGPAGTWVLRLRDLERARRAAEGYLAADLAELDGCVLQNLILGPHLHISPEALANTERVSYTIHQDEAFQRVQTGQAQAAFILNPTTVEQVWRAATQGVTMPQKSTYFYPKLLTGLILNPLDGE